MLQMVVNRVTAIPDAAVCGTAASLFAIALVVALRSSKPSAIWLLLSLLCLFLSTALIVFDYLAFTPPNATPRANLPADPPALRFEAALLELHATCGARFLRTIRLWRDAVAIAASAVLFLVFIAARRRWRPAVIPSYFAAARHEHAD